MSKLGDNCKCLTCRYFDQKSEKEGICRLQPPKIYVVGGYLNTAWPAVTINDFCGSWSKSGDRHE